MKKENENWNDETYESPKKDEENENVEDENQPDDPYKRLFKLDIVCEFQLISFAGTTVATTAAAATGNGGSTVEMHVKSLSDNEHPPPEDAEDEHELIPASPPLQDKILDPGPNPE
ncbi:hypothetical protein L2E82_45050 [Cichorium intybus]|uniref:Uncharacterized protein n=1 Tax=Cichorium intybus TaxID=13427 RepID=A0ACB8ZS93_CICIN|nr:hypothetical protein L2E82_45050 [Cichorium intybus]